MHKRNRKRPELSEAAGGSVSDSRRGAEPKQATVRLGDMLTNEQMDFIVRTLAFPDITDEGRREILTRYFEPISIYLRSYGTPLEHLVAHLVAHKDEVLARVVRRN